MKRPIALRAAICVAAVVSACGGGETATPPIWSVTTRDFSFETPDTLAAGPVRLVMINEGPSYHHVQVVRLEADIPWSDAVDSLPRDGLLLPSWMVPVGGAEGPDDYSRTFSVDLDLDPGRHLLICRIHAPDGRAHSAHGMVHSLVVTGVRSEPRVIPPHDAAIALHDHAFTAPDTLRAGDRRLLVENRGVNEHHVGIARLRPGRTLADAMVEQPQGADPVYDVLGGTAGLAPGMSNLLLIRLEPGDYVLICYVTDSVTGRVHFQLGMIRALTIVP